nr:MAG: hypothetical protein [Microvirus sp.]
MARRRKRGSRGKKRKSLKRKFIGRTGAAQRIGYRW